MFNTFYKNKDIPTVISDVHFYDIGSCYYNMLLNIDYDISNIDFDDKKKRNIAIGKLQRDNSTLAYYLQNETTNVINTYINLNNIKKENVILIQRDGLYIWHQKIKTNNTTLPIEYIYKIIRMIFNQKKDMFIFFDSSNKLHYKGFSKKYYDLSFLNLFKNIDYTNKKTIINSLDGLKRKFFSSNKNSWFITQNKKTEEYYIPIIGIGDIKIDLSIAYDIDSKDIDKNQIWENVVWQFCQSILITYII